MGSQRALSYVSQLGGPLGSFVGLDLDVLYAYLLLVLCFVLLLVSSFVFFAFD